MNSIQLYIILIASLTSVACALPGVFLVLRGVALMSDAISHAILLGIAVMFLIVQRLESPFLIFGATLAGLLTVVCTESLIYLCSLKKDAAIGLVFPLFFSIGVIVISRYARNVHLDTDMILLGEIAFAPFNRLVLFEIDLGPYALWLLTLITLLNMTFVFLFYKELKLVTFDPDLAKVLGFSPLVFYYALMVLTSITTVVSFDIVGAIVVVALMITPAATAYLLTNRLLNMLIMSMGFGISSSVIGYWIAHIFDVSIAGCIATMTGFFFLCTLFFAPEKGIIACIVMKKKNTILIGKKMLCVYLAKQNNYNNGLRFYSVEDIMVCLNWKRSLLNQIIQQAYEENYIKKESDILLLTEKGYEYAQS